MSLEQAILNHLFIFLAFRFLIAGESFRLQSRRVTDPGFTLAMPWQAVDDEESLDGLVEGAQLPVK